MEERERRLIYQRHTKHVTTAMKYCGNFGNARTHQDDEELPMQGENIAVGRVRKGGERDSGGEKVTGS